MSRVIDRPVTGLGPSMPGFSIILRKGRNPNTNSLGSFYVHTLGFTSSIILKIVPQVRSDTQQGACRRSRPLGLPSPINPMKVTPIGGPRGER